VPALDAVSLNRGGATVTTTAQTCPMKPTAVSFCQHALIHPARTPQRHSHYHRLLSLYYESQKSTFLFLKITCSNVDRTLQYLAKMYLRKFATYLYYAAAYHIYFCSYFTARKQSAIQLCM